MLEQLKKYKIVLASNSPRRKELLAGLGIDFEVRTMKGIDESWPEELQGEDIPKHISHKKAEAYLTTLKSDELLITADTIVLAPLQLPRLGGDTVLGKPIDASDARRMLHLLSGCTHEVITGVTIATQKKQTTFAVTSHVTFADLTDEEIDYYIAQYRPFDKAGAYGIQEWIGYVGATSLEGSYFNVMGLPVQRLYTELKKF